MEDGKKIMIRGIDTDFGPYQAEIFTNDLHPTLKANFILANPPFSYHPWMKPREAESRKSMMNVGHMKWLCREQIGLLRC